jgi:pre-mRNA-splicing factor ISY1
MISVPNHLPPKQRYKYFGAAKDLPGVRELFEQQDHQEKTARKTRKELYKHILPDYYGWRDEDDGILLEAEKLAETSILQDELEKMPAEYRDYVLNGGPGGMPGLGDGSGSLLGGTLSAGGVLGGGGVPGRKRSSEMGGIGGMGGIGMADNDSGEPGSKRPKMQAYVHTPSEEEIAKLLLERKKELLLKKMNKYITKEDQEKQDDMNAMIG